MSEENKVAEAVAEVRNASEEDLKKVIEDWFERTRTQGMKIGAKMISAAIYGVIKKNIAQTAKPSLRDYKRCIDGILEIISIQLTEQNDLKQEKENDSAAE